MQNSDELYGLVVSGEFTAPHLPDTAAPDF